MISASALPSLASSPRWAELRYDVCDDFDYDGTTMHAAAGTVRYVERVGLNPQATAFESNRTADTEDTARDQQARCSAQSRDLQLTLKTLRTKEAKCSGTLLTATASGSVFKVHDATKALEEATGKVQKAVSKQATLEQKVRVAMNDIETSKRNRLAATERADAEKVMIVKRAEADAISKYHQGEGMWKR